MSQVKTNEVRAAKLPEHGPVNEDGREILLSLKNVDITFGKGEDAVRAVQNASFDIYKGETFSLVGESGSGKTTVGRAVIRVNPLAAGEIQYKGVRISGKIPRALDREVHPEHSDGVPGPADALPHGGKAGVFVGGVFRPGASLQIHDRIVVKDGAGGDDACLQGRA